MIATATTIGLSGVQAAQKRVENSANNIANIHSSYTREGGQTIDKPFTPRQVDQVSLRSGGVNVLSREVEPATLQVADASGGTKALPNVNLEQELVNLKLATYDFKANLKSIVAEDENIRTMLDIFA